MCLACTMALALLAGLPALKMPLPTKTPSMPICIISAASAGVATPPAAKFTTGSRPKCFVCSSTYKVSGQAWATSCSFAPGMLLPI